MSFSPKKSLASKSIIIITIILLVLGYAINRKPITLNLSDCVLEANKIDYSCLKTHFRSKVHTSDDARASMQMIKSNPQLLPTACHDTAHIIGEILYSKNNSLNYQQVLTTCSTSCELGCIHGYFIGYAKSSENFLPSLIDTCAQIDTQTGNQIQSCFHMLGHTLIELRSYDLGTSLTLCDQVPDLHQFECARGAVMEYFTTLPMEDFSFEFSPQNFFSFCQNQKEKYARDACLSDVGRYATALENYQVGIQTCQLIHDTNLHSRCIQGLFGQYAVTHEFSQTWEVCSNQLDSLTCIQGSLSALKSNEYHQEYLQKFCQTAPLDSLKKTCNKNL